MKNLLVPVLEHDLLPSVLRTALLTAQRFGSTVEGFCLQPALAEYVPVDMVGGMTWMRDAEGDEGAAAHAAAAFTRYFEEAGAAREEAGQGPGQGASGPRFRWRHDAPPGDGFLGQHARLFNATVVGRPGSGESMPRMATLEAALFESGRPILIAPPTPPDSLGRRILVAWNRSTETARAVALAASFLREAEEVIVLDVEGAGVPGPSAEALAAALAGEGVAARGLTMAPGKRAPGEIFITEAQALGCDLVIKGAYTQSRLRQMIFGGVTSHILANATTAVFMAH
jgi:nucleotide-binding universal stress UspA family protein